MTLKVSLILSALNSEKLSAQSPPCNRKALPSDTSLSWLLRDLTSPAKTRGGKLANLFSTSSSSSIFS